MFKNDVTIKCNYKRWISFFWHSSKYERNGHCAKLKWLTLHETHCVHTSMIVRKKKWNLFFNRGLVIITNVIASEAWQTIEAKFYAGPPCIREWKFVQMMMVTWADWSHIYVRLDWVGEKKIVRTVVVSLPRWPPCSYVSKRFQNILLVNWETTKSATWFEWLGSRGLPSLCLIKW